MGMYDATDALRRVIAGEDLARGEMEALIGALMDGALTPAMQAALLTALASKGESVDEIAGAAAAMRRRVVPVAHHRPEAVDTCGTGGDGKGTFNISTAAAIVAAAAGAPVAKHGNRSVSSRSGSADLLEALGVRVQQTPERAAAALDEIGIAFLFAPGFHPAMKRVMPVRRALGVRTLFNVLGPLTNPAGARRQLLGVYAPHLVDRLAAVLAELGSVHALVVHGADGLDEITLTGPTRLAELRDGRVESRTLEPEELGLARVPAAALAGGEPADNAAALERLLAGERGALAEVAVLNAAAAVYVAGLAEDLREGVERARRTLGSGAAAAKLEELRRFSVEGG
jgi:anthranilate phosphoribosyltransferase